MKTAASSTSLMSGKAMTFYLPKRNDYSLAKTVRAIVEAIPMSEGVLRLVVSTTNAKSIEQFTLQSKHLRAQFFNTIKSAYLEDVLLKSYRVQLIVHPKTNAA